MTRVCGVYVIRCVPTKREYVGSSIDILCRWATHKKHLRRGCHVNTKLQRAWNKYGPENFTHSILEECGSELRIDRETHWIQKRRSFRRGFNMTAVADPLVHAVSTLEWRRRASERCKRLHQEGKLSRPERTAEHHKRSSERMKRLRASGAMTVSNEVWRRVYHEQTANGVVRNTPEQRAKAAQTLRDWHRRKKEANV